MVSSSGAWDKKRNSASGMHVLSQSESSTDRKWPRVKNGTDESGGKDKNDKWEFHPASAAASASISLLK
jgi:hypothetical protein